MRHIDEFTIHRFRGIRDLKLEGPGQINLLVGNNNSGKTSVLEALSIYCDPLNWRKWNDAASSREAQLGISRLSQNDRLLWLFPQWEDSDGNVPSNIKDSILLSASGSFPLKKISAGYEKFSQIIQMKSPRADETLVLEERDVEVEGLKVNVAAFNGKQNLLASNDVDEVKETLVFLDRSFPSESTSTVSVLPTQLITPSSHRLNNLPPQLWTGVLRANMKSDVVELLQLFERGIQEIEIISPTERRSLVSIKHKKLGSNLVPLSTFGDGLRRIFTLATAIPRAKGGLLLVDELETAIHTRVLNESFRWLIKACIQHDIQLFATTHSLEAIDAVKGACADEAIDLVAYRLEDGEEHTDVTRFDKGLITRLREELGLEIR